MNAKEVIDSYVSDVAVQLPRRQRNDVAFELRALLGEELQARSEAAGREADAGMAMELLNGFGRPADVAARYRPALTIIDPSDGRRFLRATVIGLAILWSLGLLVSLQQPLSSGWDLLGVLGRWWGGVVIPSLWWPGLLVTGFGLASWSRRRWPQSAEWTPRSGERSRGGRVALVMGLIGILAGLFVLIDPRWVLDVLFGGRAAPAAYEALTYTGTFRGRQAPWLFGLILLNAPLLLAVIVSGRWSPFLRRLKMALGLATCAVMVWTILDGPVLAGPAGDRSIKFALAVTVLFWLIHAGVTLRRSVRPAPYLPDEA